jgi:transcriptional regulator with XRE-family HTH domain
MPDAGEGRPALTESTGIGARVTALRADRGLSLSELARRAGIGKATLSGLESGTRNPTLETLYAVTSALGLPLTALVAAPGPVRGAAAEMALLRVFDDGPVTYELYRMRLPAGATQTSPAHHAGVTEHVTVFAGVLHSGPLAGPLRAGPGEHVEWPADQPHGYTAEEGADVEASLLIRYPRLAPRAGP